MDIKAIKNKFEKLSQREKIITAITLTVITVLVPYMLLYSPSVLKAKSKQQMLRNLKAEVEAMNLALASMRALQKEKPAEKIVLPEADDLSGMLAAISREANMARVEFISIAPEGVEYKDKFIELKVKIELRVRFRELHDFLRSIETKHRLFLIQDMKYETNSTLYPSGIALLRAVTYLRKKQ